MKSHWEEIYRTKAAHEVSWFQPEARISLDLIQRAAPDRAAEIIDVGGGASTLVDGLLAAGYEHVTVLDVVKAALDQARQRLGLAATGVRWLEADTLTVTLPTAGYDVWHDRAVFHFLIDQADRDRYIAQVRHAVRPGGYVLVSTFAEDGPTRCSGLPVTRYAPHALRAQFGSGFQLLESVREDHVTPSGVHQAFVCCLCRFGASREP
jgi:SAM-dependent methyltransferase